MSSLDGKVAVVTGASRGIGLAVARRLGTEGAAIAAVSTSAEHSEAAAARLREAGVATVNGYGCNVARTADVEATCARILEEFGHADILVNCAGITRDTLLARMDETAWDSVLDVNLKGAYLMAKNLHRSMMKGRFGRIVLISSVVALSGNAGQTNYAAAKAGLLGFGKSLARELGSRNITVNVIAPGFVETDMTAALPEEARNAFLEHVPLRRAGQPEDIAGAVAFLVGPDAGYITGQVLAVDGGFCMQ
jgi:3-oxoacyl-[acyl-carrier protein] reductase